MDFDLSPSETVLECTPQKREDGNPVIVQGRGIGSHHILLRAQGVEDLE